MLYKDPVEDAQRPRASCDINPSSGFNCNLIYFSGDFLAESFNFKQFKPRFSHKFDLNIS